MIKNIIEFVFTSALFVNALIFIPQAIKIWKDKTASGVSLWTFLGFLIIQFSIVLHGIIYRDYILSAGYLFAMSTCGTVVILVLIYGKNKQLANTLSATAENKSSTHIVEGADVEQTKQADLDRLEMLEKIVALMPGHVYWVNREGVYLGCNDQQAKSAGLVSREEVVGRRNKDLPWNSNATVLPETLDTINDEVIKTGKSITIEEPATLIDGTKKIFLSNKVPLLNSRGDIIGMVGISIDITEKKQAEKALEEANYARLEFISTASHEVRNPIGSVIVLAGLLKENLITLQDSVPNEDFNSSHADKLSAEVILKTVHETFEQCSEICGEAERALTALQNLSNLHRMQLRGITTHLELFSIKQLLSLAIKESTYQNINNVKIEQSISLSVPQNIFIDSKNIMAALSIVIGNAFRFSREGGKININVEVSQKDREKLLIISVQDFGVGMHEEQIKNLLMTMLHSKAEEESIYRKPSVQLSRVKMYIEASSGYLAIKSTLHKGTIVELTIPYALPVDKHSEKIMDNLSEDKIGVEKRVEHTVYAPIGSVLLVEDDRTIQKITCSELVGLGYEVDVCENGTDAIRMAIENNYDIILLDISLPDINGLDVMRKIRTLKGDETIFIALSSHSSEDDEEYFIKQGAMALIPKPLKIQQLKIIMEVALKIKTKPG